METISVLSKSSEHWLTTMMCTICERTPDQSPLYRCSMGHMICNSCFEYLAQNGIPKCNQCGSLTFRKRHVSQDFLQKLKSKPGIGRPRRYHFELTRSPSDSGDSDVPECRDKTVTIEKLFQLTTEQIKQLFETTAKHRVQDRRKTANISSCAGVRCHSDTHINVNRRCVKSNVNNTLSPLGNYHRYLLCKDTSNGKVLSRKPSVCPHGYCKKVVTISSFFQHFKHEHPEIPSFAVERGKELHLIHDVRVVEHGITYCMAIIKVYEIYQLHSHNDQKFSTLADRLNQKVSVATFWLMVSGSDETKRSASFVLYWLITNTDEPFTCTIEMSSMNESCSNSTFCGVNGIFDSHQIEDVVHRLNCLNMNYASVRNLLEDGPKLNLRITIH